MMRYAREWNLKPIPNVTDGVPGGTVELRRILVVFHGGDVVCCEESWFKQLRIMSWFIGKQPRKISKFIVKQLRLLSK